MSQRAQPTTEPLALIKELYSTLVSSNHTSKTISIIPSEEIGFTVVEDGCLEIGMSKQTYLLLFKQCHDLWHQDPQELDPWDAYYMTLGFLITTNENHTIITLHETLTQKLVEREGPQFLHREIDIISAFLSSRLKRINKSSSLWLYMKKMMVLTDDYQLHELMINRALISCQLHFANYYAANFLRWCICVGAARSSQFETRLTHLCHANFKDVSLWGLQEVWYLYNGGYTGTVVSECIDEYNRLAGAQSRPSLSVVRPESDVTARIRTEFSWLLQVECCAATPYQKLIDADEQLTGSEEDLLKQAKEKLKEHQEKLEETHGQVRDVSHSALLSQREMFTRTLQILVRHAEK